MVLSQVACVCFCVQVCPTGNVMSSPSSVFLPTQTSTASVCLTEQVCKFRPADMLPSRHVSMVNRPACVHCCFRFCHIVYQLILLSRKPRPKSAYYFLGLLYYYYYYYYYYMRWRMPLFMRQCWGLQVGPMHETTGMGKLIKCLRGRGRYGVVCR